jgi:hypothetical protein
MEIAAKNSFASASPSAMSPAAAYVPPSSWAASAARYAPARSGARSTSTAHIVYGAALTAALAGDDYQPSMLDPWTRARLAGAPTKHTLVTQAASRRRRVRRGRDRQGKPGLALSGFGWRSASRLSKL